MCVAAVGFWMSLENKNRNHIGYGMGVANVFDKQTVLVGLYFVNCQWARFCSTNYDILQLANLGDWPNLIVTLV